MFHLHPSVKARAEKSRRLLELWLSTANCLRAEEKSSIVNGAGWVGKKLKARCLENEREKRAIVREWDRGRSRPLASCECSGPFFASVQEPIQWLLSLLFSQLYSECWVLPDQYTVALRDAAITLSIVSLLMYSPGLAQWERERAASDPHYITEVLMGKALDPHLHQRG